MKKEVKKKSKVTTAKDQRKGGKGIAPSKKRLSKSAVIILIVCISIALFALGVFLLYTPEEEKNFSSDEYYPANYDENIFENHAYMSFERDLRFSQGGVEQLFNYEKDFESASAECQFFLNYFNTVIHGDYETYKSYFVDNYFDEDPKFTMQMIYDPSVHYHSVSTDEIDGEEINLINFRVVYRIFKNNKTYRSNVDSNVAIPQIYQLIKEVDGSYRIFRIFDIQEENEA